MKIIGITQKLKKRSKIKIEEIPDEMPYKIDCWHANLYKYGRKSGVIFVNDLTRYAVVLFGITKPNYSRIIKLFLFQLERNMLQDGFETEEIEKFSKGFDEVRYTKTSSRSILGTIKDYLQFVDFSGEDLKELSQTTIDELNFSLNDMPILPLEREGFQPYPNKALRECLKK